MKKPILYAALCLSGTAGAQDTTYFKQDFEDYRLRTWAEHVDNRDTETSMALPHVKFNRIRGGRAERALLDTTLAGVVLDNRSLEVFIPDSTRNNDEMYLRYHVTLGEGWFFERNQLVKIPGLAGTYNAGAGGWKPDPDQGRRGGPPA